MKKIFLTCLLLLLCACSSLNLDTSLDNVFNNIDSIENYNANNSMKYFSYYLPSSFGEYEVTSDSLTLSYGESTIIMNLNIADIINGKYYEDSMLEDEGFFNSDDIVYENSGTYTLTDGSEKQYLYKIYDYDKYYALYLKTNDNVFYGNVIKGDIKEVTRLLLIMVKSISVETDLVVSTYSSKDTIDYQKKQIDLFNYQKPTSGTLSDMLTDDATIGNETTDTTDDQVNDNQVDNNEEVNNEEIIEENTDSSENEEASD